MAFPNVPAATKQHVNEINVFYSKFRNPDVVPWGFVDELGLGLPEVGGRATRRRVAPRDHQNNM